MLRFHRSTAVLAHLTSATFFLGMFIAVPGHADDAAELKRLLHNRQHAEALTRVEAALTTKPNDPQMRFLKGVILTEQNKALEAIAVFTQLVEEHPGIPEPYNNLAVLYASTGQYEKARAALDAAIRANPNYATAHENLGDVYAKLASQAYQKALQLDKGNAAAKTKLQSMGALLVPTSVPVAKPGSADASTRTAGIASPSAAVEAEVITVVNNWARSWSDKDVTAYLAAYDNAFILPSGQSRTVWENNRRARITDKGNISVKIESPRVTVSDNTATVKFLQAYDSDRYRDRTHKTLVLTKQNGTWKIKEERTGA